MEMVGLTTLPKEVVFNHLYPYLRFNDLLRQRRLCQWSKPLAEDYIRIKAVTKRCVDVSLAPEEPNNLAALLNLSWALPLSNIYTETEYDDSEDVDKQVWDMEEHTSRFLTLYGKNIKQLDLDSLEIPMSSKALAFFESLLNLEHLKIDTWTVNNLVGELELPSTFRKLKKLYIKRYFWNGGIHSIARRRQVFEKFLEWCQPCLESFSHVNYYQKIQDELDNPPADIFEPVTTTLIQVESPVLKVYELSIWANYVIDLHDNVGIDFYRLLTACYRKNVKLLRVNAFIFFPLIYRLENNHLEMNAMLSNVISSLWSIDVHCFYLELPHLESIGIRSTDLCAFPQVDFERKAWSTLKRLRIWVDSPNLSCGTPTVQLLNYFFVGIQREKMEQLELKIWNRDDGDLVPFPRAVDIGNSCPNLKKLHLGLKWSESNLAISKLWEMLPLLEVLKFQSCLELANEAFLGENLEELSILKLKNLTTLKFLSLDLMPKITDDIFHLVLRHMPLKELYLEASEDEVFHPEIIPQITVAGIKSLLSGMFAETIERFPLKGRFKLNNVSDEELSALEKEFRSYNML